MYLRGHFKAGKERGKGRNEGRGKGLENPLSPKNKFLVTSFIVVEWCVFGRR